MYYLPFCSLRVEIAAQKDATVLSQALGEKAAAEGFLGWVAGVVPQNDLVRLISSGSAARVGVLATQRWNSLLWVWMDTYSAERCADYASTVASGWTSPPAWTVVFAGFVADDDAVEDAVLAVLLQVYPVDVRYL